MASRILQVGDIIVAVMKGKLFNQSVQSTFHYRSTAVDGTYTLKNFLTGLNATLLDNYVKCVSRDWTGDVLYGRILAPVKSRGEETSLGAASGDIAEDSLPPSVAAVIGRYTLVPGPGGRGRIFLPAIPQSWNDAGLLSVAGVTAMTDLQQFMAESITPLAGNTFEPVLWKRPNLALPLTDTKIQRVLRSQRRREVGVGI